VTKCLDDVTPSPTRIAGRITTLSITTGAIFVSINQPSPTYPIHNSRQRSWRRFLGRLIRPFHHKVRALAASTIIEQSRYRVPLGDEARVVNNSQSSSSTIRKVRLAREWTRTWIVDVERTTMAHGSVSLDIHFLDLSAEAGRVLREAYSIRTGERATFEEEVTLRIAPHTRSEILFSWQEIRQRGVVKIETDHFEARIPYEIVVGLTFDQQQIDIPNHPANSGTDLVRIILARSKRTPNTRRKPLPMVQSRRAAGRQR
jgi:hypothetical protein